VFKPQSVALFVAVEILLIGGIVWLAVAFPNQRVSEGQLNECYRLIYKRGCQGHFSPSTGRRRYFLAFQPRA
jgi:hypothetical protein